jgi:hypothetical protein
MLPVNARNNSADMVVNDGFKWRTGAMAMTRSTRNGTLLPYSVLILFLDSHLNLNACSRSLDMEKSPMIVSTTPVSM